MTYRWVRENAQRLVGEPLAVGDWSDLLVGLQRSLNARGLSDQDLWTAVATSRRLRSAGDAPEGPHPLLQQLPTGPEPGESDLEAIREARIAAALLTHAVRPLEVDPGIHAMIKGIEHQMLDEPPAPSRLREALGQWRATILREQEHLSHPFLAGWVARGQRALLNTTNTLIEQTTSPTLDQERFHKLLVRNDEDWRDLVTEWAHKTYLPPIPEAARRNLAIVTTRLSEALQHPQEPEREQLAVLLATGIGGNQPSADIITRGVNDTSLKWRDIARQLTTSSIRIADVIPEVRNQTGTLSNALRLDRPAPPRAPGPVMPSPHLDPRNLDGRGR